MASESRKRSQARDRAAAAYAEEQAKARRKRQYLIGGLVVIVIAAAVGIGIGVQHHVNQTNSSAANGPLVFPSGTVDSGLAIPFGSDQNAKVTLTIYEDFRCPFCKEAESMFNPIYTADADAGKIVVKYHIVNLIDQNSGGTGSIQAGNAAACAQNVGNAKFKAYHDILYANQPDESDDAFSSNSLLISYAKQVSGLDGSTFESCVNSGRYQPWVVKNYNALNTAESGNVSTPDYLINGTRYNLTSQSASVQQAAFTAALNKAISAAG
ncbi:DsbA family protein [Actinospica sp.]|uniref:DsbA family protein n=1 Tax=Actinospica sp. TaxID=1872142 RepID=UPI002B574787|nr:thioredoxin domain-containing protein [Actinospica sp.]HWG25719.1 thioredoxin domain-containing protein [Actinospica sp.]